MHRHTQYTCCSGCITMDTKQMLQLQALLKAILAQSAGCRVPMRQLQANSSCQHCCSNQPTR